jgi:ACS family sodium-dependent inorganic phosphate cotransporter
MALGGLLADKYGGKIVLAYGVFFWSIFTILTPAFAYSGFWLLMFIRILMGLGEGITFPSWHALYARWIPFNERTRAIAITNSGISVGTVFGYLATALIIREYSWELVFYVFGMFGIVWVYFWHRSITSKPEDHPKILKSELDLIQKEAPAKSTADKIPLSKLICNGPFIAIVIATFCNNWALFTFLSYLPKFVNSPVSIGGLGIDLGSNLFIAIILLPSIVSVISLIAGGYIADMLIKRGVKTIIVRKTANSFGFYGAAFCLYLISFQESIFNIVVLLCLINLSSGIGAGGFGVNHADLGPKYTGSLVGISGGLGMIAAILSPIVAGLILESTNSWDLIFNICCGALVFGGTFYLFFASSDKQFN